MDGKNTIFYFLKHFQKCLTKQRKMKTIFIVLY